VKTATRFASTRRYLFLLFAIGSGLALWLANREAGARGIDITLRNLKEMLIVLPPIFIILGLLDVWVPRERMIKLMGEGSGWRGTLLAFLLGSAAAGPLYAAFPVAQVLLKKGASMRNVLILLGAWSTAKIPMLMFELTNMGARFTVTRLIVDLGGILLIALLMERFMEEKDRNEIQAKAEGAAGPGKVISRPGAHRE
jgi:uncharacterized membrane protein YraQ (UPF0718 family)